MKINELRKERALAANFKDNKIIYERLQAFSAPENCEIELEDIIKAKGNFSHEEEEEIFSLAQALKSWRKGPFQLGQTFIDSEWQSFIKYNLIKDFFNLENKIVGDIGCNNGYYMFRMLKEKPKKLVGFDPGFLNFMQFSFVNNFIKSDISYELLGVEHLPYFEHKFDTLFCLGVLYHRSDPIKTLKELKAGLNPQGEVILDTMYIDMEGEFALSPKNTYCKIPNIYFIPTIKALENWCERAKFKDFEILASKTTDLNEQRKTEWIKGESLNDFLDKENPALTVEAYLAPKRIYIKCKA